MVQGGLKKFQEGLEPPGTPLPAPLRLKIHASSQLWSPEMKSMFRAFLSLKFQNLNLGSYVLWHRLPAVSSVA